MWVYSCFCLISRVSIPDSGSSLEFVLLFFLRIFILVYSRCKLGFTCTNLWLLVFRFFFFFFLGEGGRKIGGENGYYGVLAGMK